ncbi:hypothetical protein B0H10DRAFT_1209048 [Mycena sp. CBHHK59/15]|nr:hypothetical protein B0H10DRAFT_1209048 [Mycena sp. CBHHK59/15]
MVLPKTVLDFSPASFPELGTISRLDGTMPFNDPNLEAMVISSLRRDHYHELCFHKLCKLLTLSISTQATVRPEAIICCSSISEAKGLDEIPSSRLVEIASLPGLNVQDSGWDVVGWYDKEVPIGEVMPDSWIRYNSCDVLEISRAICIERRDFLIGPKFWIGQANHIFSRLQITSNYEDYVFVEDIFFLLESIRRRRTRRTRSGRRDNPRELEGYLFLCPEKDLQTGSSFRWPDCPAYWSLDPSGAERLSTEDAKYLGFPTINLRTLVNGRSWDASVYAGLRRFDQAKGFDPDSQDLARHLGHPLYQLSSELDVPFAFVDLLRKIDDESDHPASCWGMYPT